MSSRRLRLVKGVKTLIDGVQYFSYTIEHDDKPEGYSVAMTALSDKCTNLDESSDFGTSEHVMVVFANGDKAYIKLDVVHALSRMDALLVLREVSFDYYDPDEI